MLTPTLPLLSAADLPARAYPPVNLNWFAVRVKSKHEKVAANSLKAKGYETFLPLYKRWGSRGTAKPPSLPLFPGYVFCRFDALYRLPILTTPSVLYVVSNNTHLISVDDTEIEAIQRCVQSKLNPKPWPYLKEGQLVEVQTGPLRGLKGVLLLIKGQRRLVVSVGLLQRSVAAELDESAVSPV